MAFAIADNYLPQLLHDDSQLAGAEAAVLLQEVEVLAHEVLQHDDSQQRRQRRWPQASANSGAIEATTATAKTAILTYFMINPPLTET